ncbi:PhzF family phenazine biosynthesis protein [Caenispirillum salinarum]|uniref:PhzF family phenazine biosynthesis protein n=1 Tax=Caenispirillum salinarum TaxID=859058 RepID=UPI00384D4A57
MRQYHFLTCDVFTDTAFGGNPLAVVPEAEGLDDRTMQTIAREFNLSETIFVLPPKDPAHTASVRIFTPARELPFAGHPTVGCALTLAALNRVERDEAGRGSLVLEMKAGPVPIVLDRDDSGRPTATFTAPGIPTLGAEGLPPAPVIARMLGLEPGDVVAREPLSPAVCTVGGVAFAVVPVAPDALSRIRLNSALYEEYKQGGAPDPYVVALDDPQRPSAVHARMFAPAMGIPEDPATGSAATALAAWLDRVQPGTGRETLAWTIIQGADMGRPSTIALELDREDDTMTAVRIGGSAVLVSDGTMAVP